MFDFKSASTLILRRVPEFFRAPLFERTSPCISWDKYRGQSEVLTRVVFSDVVVSPVISHEVRDVNISEITRKRERGLCVYHGKCWHNSENCDKVLEAIRDYKLKEKKDINKIVAAKNNVDDLDPHEENNTIKNNFIYSNFTINAKSSQFIIAISCCNKGYQALLDTGRMFQLSPVAF